MYIFVGIDSSSRRRSRSRRVRSSRYSSPPPRSLPPPPLLPPAGPPPAPGSCDVGIYISGLPSARKDDAKSIVKCPRKNRKCFIIEKKYQNVPNTKIAP